MSDDRLRQLEQQVRELRDLVRVFTRLPTMPVGDGQGFDRCAARAKDAFATTTPTITVNNVTIEVGLSPLEDPDDLTEELQVQNRYRYEGESGDDLTIAWREDREEWYLLQKGCPEEA